MGPRTILVAPMLLVLEAISAPAQPVDVAYGEYLASECMTCHREAPDQRAIPPIAGLPRESFVDALRAYRAGRRINPVMKNVARSLDDRQIEALAAYFASLRKEKP
jgi:cytochrome c553